MVFCFSCGSRLEASLESGGALRCHDCRDRVTPLQPELVATEQSTRPVLTLIRTLPTLLERGDPPPCAAA